MSKINIGDYFLHKEKYKIFTIKEQIDMGVRKGILYVIYYPKTNEYGRYYEWKILEKGIKVEGNKLAELLAT